MENLNVVSVFHLIPQILVIAIYNPASSLPASAFSVCVLAAAALLAATQTAEAQYSVPGTSQRSIGETYWVEAMGGLWNPSPQGLIQSASLGIAGSQLDFVDDLIGQAFKIENPHATAACGCGTTFSIEVTTTWILGSVCVRSPLPSLVTMIDEPVSATRKLPPVMPTSARKYLSRSTLRASLTRSAATKAGLVTGSTTF